MARSITFSRFPWSHRACTNPTFGNGGTALANSAFERFQFARKEIETRGIQIHHRRQLTLSLTSRDDVPYTPRSYSPGERAKQLYEYINEKNLEALDEIISEDCCFEDFYFPTPFDGKKEILHFFEQLTSNMGKNVRFNLRNVGEDENSAWVNWHLEWSGDEIPFTRGCSFYEFSKDEERLVIRKAQVFVEWPIKPGGTVLILLKTITSLFDDFPEVSDRFLKSPRAIVQWAMRIYNMFLAPFISTLLANYMNSWKFMAPMLGYALQVIISVLKIFFK
ncbi:uncharacterized protein LOC108960189 [Eucalyptus grandis]|uniref:uncharacterized protein LOC108960189 n=1 Tax=Eucalyptus grandis TaxID=71139 RepID=UPI00192E9C1A|nr:uncharacterized protein LOC108960189 [Eucalyptus grandis]